MLTCHLEGRDDPVPAGRARTTQCCCVGRRAVQRLIDYVDHIEARVARGNRGQPGIDGGKLVSRG